MGVDTLTYAQSLERAGFNRAQADAIAMGMKDATSDLVTAERLETALLRQTIRLGGIAVALAGICTAVLALVISLHH